MLVLGWDIGIKNLSYCLVEYDNQSVEKLDKKTLTTEQVYKTCKIIDWGIVDLRDEEIIAQESLPKSKKKKETEIGVKGKVKKAKVKKCKDMKLVDMGKRIKEKFDDLTAFRDVDYVVIENQPVLKNPTMKSIQMMVFSYFVFNVDNIIDVSLLNANNKMKVCHYEVSEELMKTVTKVKSKYTRNKKLSIIHTNLMLQHLDESNQFKELFNESKKKDDLADSYLMTLFFVANKLNSIKKIKKSKQTESKI